MAVPQAVVVALGGPWAQSAGALLAGSAIPASYVIVTGAFKPALPPWRHWLWLCSKIVGATMVSLAGGTVALAGALGIVISGPLLALAFATAVGTALLHRGVVLGALPPIAVLILLGRACMQYHFELPADTMTIHAVAYGAFGVAGILASLSALSVLVAWRK